MNAKVGGHIWHHLTNYALQLSLFIPNEMGDIRNNIYSILTKSNRILEYYLRILTKRDIRIG
jgi:hypothetical protein